MTMARLTMCADMINQQYHDYSLLDVGCRTMDLKPLLHDCRQYFGADLNPGENILECDLDRGLPFEDNSFDIITALDVLEHLDKPHSTLLELFRVARKAVFVSLPNMYYINFRLNFLRGYGISGKYKFPAKPIADRHRWVLSYDEAIQFIFENTSGYTVKHSVILPIRGRTKLIAGPIEYWLGNRWPNLFAYGVLFEIRLNKL